MKSYAGFIAAAVVGTMVGCAPMPRNGGQAGALGLPQAGTVYGQIPAAGAPQAGTAAGQVAGVGVPQAGDMAGGMGGAVGAVSTPSLVDILVQQLGVTSQQALGGAGSIFSLARQNLGAEDFARLGNAVPGMDQYLAAAPSAPASASGSAGLLGAAGSLLGDQGGTLGSVAALAGSFESLGLNAGMVSQFIPIVLQYVQTQGGAAATGLLQSALR